MLIDMPTRPPKPLPLLRAVHSTANLLFMLPLRDEKYRYFLDNWVFNKLVFVNISHSHSESDSLFVVYLKWQTDNIYFGKYFSFTVHAIVLLSVTPFFVLVRCHQVHHHRVCHRLGCRSPAVLGSVLWMRHGRILPWQRQARAHYLRWSLQAGRGLQADVPPTASPARSV